MLKLAGVINGLIACIVFSASFLYAVGFVERRPRYAS